jgi:hypothetical protein
VRFGSVLKAYGETNRLAANWVVGKVGKVVPTRVKKAAVRVAAETMRADHGPCDKAAAPATCEKVAPEATTVRLPPVLVPWRQLVPKRQDSLEARALKAVWARPAVALDASLGDGWPAPQAAARLAMAQPHTKSATSRRARSDAPGDVRRVLAWHEAQGV